MDLDTTVSDAPPWSQFEPQICLSSTKYKKDTTNPEMCKQAFFKNKSRHKNYVQIFTDGSEAVSYTHLTLPTNAEV